MTNKSEPVDPYRDSRCLRCGDIWMLTDRCPDGNRHQVKGPPEHSIGTVLYEMKPDANGVYMDTGMKSTKQADGSWLEEESK